MKLLYLSQENLGEKAFIQELVYSYPKDLRAILLHDQFGSSPSDTIFVTKRISSLFSEALVVNNAFSGNQRGLIRFSESGDVTINSQMIHHLMDQVPLLILNPLVTDSANTADAKTLIHGFRKAFAIKETILFPDRGLSPLASQKQIISNQEEISSLSTVYEEEATVLDLAKEILPVSIASATNFFH